MPPWGVKSAREWRAFYARERDELGAAGLEALVRSAPEVALPARGALVFPHTRLAQSGRLVAAVARALVLSERETVVALGVLHGARTVDRAQVTAARKGDATARAALRRVHGPGAADDDGRWEEEFSLDALRVLLEAAGRVERRRPPRVIARYPFLVGDSPADLPGIDELERLIAKGAAIVATADPIHHGAGYATPLEERRARGDPRTHAWARGRIEDALGLLFEPNELPAFLERCLQDGNDFRDAGPVLAHLLPEASARIVDLALVDYADVLAAEEPTWVAGALVQVDRG